MLQIAYLAKPWHTGALRIISADFENKIFFVFVSNFNIGFEKTMRENLEHESTLHLICLQTNSNYNSRAIKFQLRLVRNFSN